MGIYNGNEMRSMMTESFSDARMNKSRELNDNMSIDTSKSEDKYGQQVHSLSKQEYDENNQSV